MVALAVLTTPACTEVTPGAEQDGLMGDSTPSSSAVPSAHHGPGLLRRGECATRPPSRGADAAGSGVTEVRCASERAFARVTVRHEGRTKGGPNCPARTDFVLHINEHRPDVDEDGDGGVPLGYACMRQLDGPHPGDPGAGGGPNTISGDCVYTTSGRREVKETPCAGEGAREPAYRVFRVVEGRADCPESTALFVDVGGDRPVGCARRH
ncbi:hypothetical protein E0L36_01825 [Streptomyces sp. AJS327]|nr:hypothetical protein [Streptomyces sp. AJS327]